jgi:anti-anti-sigma factor
MRRTDLRSARFTGALPPNQSLPRHVLRRRAVHARDGQPEAFAVSVERHGWRTTVTVRRELDLATVPALEPVLIAQDRRGGLVIMDLGAVSFIDASGLGLLLRIDAHARRDGMELQLAPSSSVPRLLELWPPRDPLHVRHPAA